MNSIVYSLKQVNRTSPSVDKSNETTNESYDKQQTNKH